MKKLKNAGLGVVELLLIFVIVALVGGTGWFVWHSKQTADKNLGSSGSNSVTFKNNAPTTFAECKKSAGSKMLETYPEQCLTKAGKSFTDPGQSLQQYLVIKEWNVRMKLPDNLKDAYYTFPAGPTYAFLSLKSLVALAPDCAPDKVSLGYIFRQTTAEYQAALADKAQNGANIDNVTGDTKVGDYYYGFANPQAYCVDSSNTAAQAIFDAAQPRTGFAAAEKTMEAVPGS